MDSNTRSFIYGICVGIGITLAASIIGHNDKNERITRLERQQAQLIEMLTYVPEIDVPEVVKTIKPKAIK
jgi:hypothetical protein